ncbi:hypothetical protein JOM56_011350 [Amanita muscaria]
MVVEFDDGNIVEWPRASGPHNPVLDGFTIRRTDDSDENSCHPLPRSFSGAVVLPELGAPMITLVFIPTLVNVIGIKEESRIGVIQALWNYIKLQNLQDKI